MIKLLNNLYIKSDYQMKRFEIKVDLIAKGKFLRRKTLSIIHSK